MRDLTDCLRHGLAVVTVGRAVPLRGKASSAVLAAVNLLGHGNSLQQQLLLGLLLLHDLGVFVLAVTPHPSPPPGPGLFTEVLILISVGVGVNVVVAGVVVVYVVVGRLLISPVESQLVADFALTSSAKQLHGGSRLGL